jgi:hypothetical protein
MTTTTKGLLLPQISSYASGTGNPRDSAIASNNAMNVKQANLNTVGGKKYYKTKTKKNNKNKKRFKGGTNGNITVPQMKTLYTPQNGSSTPNTQIAGLSSTSMQHAAWSVNDNQAAISGGKRLTKRGGKWGCYSGGKKRRCKKTNRRHK